MNIRPDLTDDEVDAICAGLKQHAAKARHLRRMGLQVQARPNGRPLVLRSEFERIMGSSQVTSAAAHNGPRWKIK
jgi:hypothetical protein